MSRKIIHVHLDVKGALLSWDDYQFAEAFTHPDGRKMTAREAKSALLDELLKGHRVIPTGDDCEGFDPTGKGCPGHDAPEEESEAA